MTEKTNITVKDEKMDLRDAADYAHVTWRALYFAIRRGNLDAIKGTDNRWYVTRKSIDDYRMNKFNPDKKRHNGETIYDIDKGYLSVTHVAKTLSHMLGRPYNVQHLYYLIRRGELTCYRKGYSVVVKREDAIALYENEVSSYKWGDMPPARLVG